MKIMSFHARSKIENVMTNLDYFYRIHSINYARIIFSTNLSIRSLLDLL